MKLKSGIFGVILITLAGYLTRNYENVSSYALDLFILGKIPGTEVIMPSEIIFLFYGLAAIVVVRYWIDFKNGYWKHVYNKIQLSKSHREKNVITPNESKAAAAVISKVQTV